MMDKIKLLKHAAKHHIFLYLVVLTPLPTQAGHSLKLSTWNTEWLVSKGNERFASSLRNNADFYKMADYFQQLDTDILAFQEVGDHAAIARVIGDNYRLYFSDRALPKNQHLQFDDINQYTGFAVRKSIDVNDRPDVSLLPSGHQQKLRFASYIVVNYYGTSIHLLNVHLKAGCAGKLTRSKQCKTLNSQAVQLNEWIEEREDNNQRYIISGDFNHNLAYRNDWMWAMISQDNQAKLATKNVDAKCKVKSRNNPKRTHQFRSLIDHIIISPQLKVETISQAPYSTDDVLEYQLSDHCPLSAQISYSQGN
ncbi:endonuclease/exonuclease/phosphatase family protein [Vibrio taketomensis]|uniref:endonuclease/exonuclease/phosphatase family protein n=1 Tax=Vibrio taketomensis TaxID=2572923 RepID=UPI001389D6DD|nr:endonuclease/exonuclease/phosphatase family protein [Vibrio taketomensis]